jgi:hypothetical protein
MRTYPTRIISVLLLVALVVPVLGGCKSDANKEIRSVASRFFAAVDSADGKGLSRLADSEGIILIRTYPSGNGTRGAEVNETIAATELPSDLTFDLVKGEPPISLQVEWRTTDDRNTSKLNPQITGTTFDWTQIDKSGVLESLEGMMGKDDESLTGNRLYVMSDGSFCLAEYSGCGFEWSRWAVFRKRGDTYTVAIIATVN